MYEKEFGRSLTKDNFAHGLNLFFQQSGIEFITQLLEKAKQLKRVLEQSHVKLIGCSLLLFYPGDKTNDAQADLKLIDFAHSLVDEDFGRDEEVLIGISNLITFLKLLQNKLF